MTNQEHLETNRRYWDRLAEAHARFEGYGIDRLRRGDVTLRSVEREELGDLGGRRVLHLMCHIGLDTMSLARLGAEAIGVDFSERAIAEAQRLASELSIDRVSFVRGELASLSALGLGTFDLVFAAYGVLDWIPDFEAMVREVAALLRPGGVFHLVDAHPLLQGLDQLEAGDGHASLSPYFFTERVRFCETFGSYAMRSPSIGLNANVRWRYSLGELVNAVIAAGLTLRHLREFPFSHYQKFDFMQQDEQGWWRGPAGAPGLPMLFSLSGSAMASIFLGGPIQYALHPSGSFDSDLRGAVERVIESLSRGGHRVLSAHVAERFGEVDMSGKSDEIAIRDMEWMKQCELFACILPGDPPSSRSLRSDGTCIELGWASALGKPILILNDPRCEYSHLLIGLHAIARARYLDLRDALAEPARMLELIAEMLPPR